LTLARLRGRMSGVPQQPNESERSYRLDRWAGLTIIGAIVLSLVLVTLGEPLFWVPFAAGIGIRSSLCSVVAGHEYLSQFLTLSRVCDVEHPVGNAVAVRLSSVRSSCRWGVRRGAVGVLKPHMHHPRIRRFLSVEGGKSVSM